MVHEDIGKSGLRGRRYARSGSVRKKMTSAQWTLFNPVLTTVHNELMSSSVGVDGQEHGHRTIDDDADKGNFTEQQIELWDDGCPICYQQSLPRVQSCNSIVSAPSTMAYDDDGFPFFFEQDDAHFAQTPPAKKPQQDMPELFPHSSIHPNQKEIHQESTVKQVHTTNTQRDGLPFGQT